jgi:hypothetical protein
VTETIVTPVEDVQAVEANPDSLPIAHVPELSWLQGDRTTRPERAMCGADLLGIEAFEPFKNCEECWDILWRLA